MVFLLQNLSLIVLFKKLHCGEETDSKKFDITKMLFKDI